MQFPMHGTQMLGTAASANDCPARDVTVKDKRAELSGNKGTTSPHID